MTHTPNPYAPNPQDPQEPVTLLSVRSEFEAETIAASLRSRGIDARPVGAMTAGFRAQTPGEVRVMVRRADLDRARATLKEIHTDSVDIAWEELNPGPPEGGSPPATAPDPRRWAWTVALVVLLPIGLFLTMMFGGPGHDPAARTMGPIVVGIALVMIVCLMLIRPPEGPGSGDTGEATP